MQIELFVKNPIVTIKNIGFGEFVWTIEVLEDHPKPSWEGEQWIIWSAVFKTRKEAFYTALQLVEHYENKTWRNHERLRYTDASRPSIC